MTPNIPQHDPLPPPGGFAVTILEKRGRVRVRVVGELDACTAPSLQQSLSGLEGRAGIPAPRGRDVELDLSGLSFLDTAGISALADCRTAMRKAGWHFRVVRAQPHIGRLLAYAAAAGWLAQDVADPGAATA